LITESFLNSCFSLILCKSTNIKRDKALYRDILEVISFSEKKQTLDVPVTIQSKTDCIKQICKMLIDGKIIDNIVDSVSFSEKFAQFRDFLDTKLNEELKDMVSADILKQIRLRMKIYALFENYDDLSNVLDSIKDGTFDSIDDLIEDYEVTIKKLYSNMMESNRSLTIQAAASLDLRKDSFKSVIDMVKAKYDRSNKTPTGFPVFDTTILRGGFEPSRLYIFGGGTGAGKSSILNNLIVKSTVGNINLLVDNNSDSKVFIYITLENMLDEAFLRTYQPMFDRTTTQVLQEITTGGWEQLEKRLKDELAKTNSTILMKYFQPMSISVIDIMGVVDEAIDEYGKDSIKGLYIDYLDLLRSDTKYDMYRLELGHITLSLKTLAVQYNIPVITASPLGKAAYEITDSSALNLGHISESIKKLEHSDFVCLLGKDPNDKTKVHGKVGKNRSGPSNISIEFKVDWERFKFLSASKVTNKKKQDAASDGTLMTFKGFNF